MLPVTSLQHRHVKSMSNLNVNRILNYSLCSLAPLTYSSVWSESQSFSRIYQKKVACPFPSSVYPFFSSVPEYWQSDWKVGHNFVLIYGQFLIQLQGTADDTESWLAKAMDYTCRLFQLELSCTVATFKVNLMQLCWIFITNDVNDDRMLIFGYTVPSNIPCF